jgi:hypothetical protein
VGKPGILASDSAVENFKISFIRVAIPPPGKETDLVSASTVHNILKVNIFIFMIKSVNVSQPMFNKVVSLLR